MIIKTLKRAVKKQSRDSKSHKGNSMTTQKQRCPQTFSH